MATPKDIFNASAHWPHYNGRLVLFSKSANQHYVIEKGKLVPTQNQAAADYARQFNPDGSRKR